MSVLSQWYLELYRYKIHNLTKPKMSTTNMSWSSYWKEYGAFVSVMPRHSGNTKFLESVAQIHVNSGDSVVVLAPSSVAIQSGRFNLPGVKIMTPQHLLYLPKTRYFDHLLVDNFLHVPAVQMNDILSHGWKSVTMAGAFR